MQLLFRGTNLCPYKNNSLRKARKPKRSIVHEPQNAKLLNSDFLNEIFRTEMTPSILFSTHCILLLHSNRTRHRCHELQATNIVNVKEMCQYIPDTPCLCASEYNRDPYPPSSVMFSVSDVNNDHALEQMRS